jgi:two-component system response regulator RstA
MKTHTILVVEDDPTLRKQIRSFLQKSGLNVGTEERGGGVLKRLEQEEFDLVVLDWMLPDLNGIELCPMIKAHSAIPVLMLTARHGEESEISALRTGADDYLTKPVRPKILLARIHNLLGRFQTEEHLPNTRGARSNKLKNGPLVIDPAQRSVTVSGKTIELTTAEYDMLFFLTKHAGRVVSRDELYLTLRGISFDGLDRSIDLRASRIRRKIDACSGHRTLIKSVRGVGYMMVRS